MLIDTWPCCGSPRTGQRQRYPGRFLHYLTKRYPETEAADTLHLFSGSVAGAFSVDLRPESGCSVAARYNALPFADNAFSCVVADPPYNRGFSSHWTKHAPDLPRPKRILAEAVRVLRPGGLAMILHVIVVPAYKALGVERVGLHPILCGPNNAVRVLNVFRKRSSRTAAIRPPLLPVG